MEGPRKRPYNNAAAKKARMASLKFSKLQPWKDYGAVRMQRGTDWSLGNFGATARTATPQQKKFRKESGWTGRGLYEGRGAYWGSKLGSFAGGALGSKLGMRDLGAKVGGWLGDKGSDALMEYAGRGSYYPSNSLIAGGRPPTVFSGSGDETGSITIANSEYLGDVFAPSTSNFSSTVYTLNPGLQQIFPFLSQFAQNFAEYEFIQLIFEFHSTVDATAVNNSAGNTGTVIMCTNYNSNDEPFTEKESMIQYHGGISGRMTEKLVHGVECDPTKNAQSAQKNIRTGFIINSDLKTFDLGKFNLAFQNIPSAFFNQQVGELWCHYKVKLDKPRLFTAQAASVAEFRCVSTPGSEAYANPLGVPLFAVGNSLSMLITQAAGVITFTFPAGINGIFEIQNNFRGTGITGSGIVGVTGNVTLFNDMYAVNSSGNDSPAWGCNVTDGNAYTSTIHVRVKAATGGVNNTFTLKPFAIATTVVQGACIIREISPFMATNNSIDNSTYVNSAGAIISPV